MSPKERHRKREKNRAKLHALKLQKEQESQKQKFIDPPASKVPPIFPETVSPVSGVKTVLAGGGARRHKPFIPNILPLPKITVVDMKVDG